MIEFVSATRDDAETYNNKSALAWSMRRLSYNPAIASRVTNSNTAGLPEVYNRAIDEDNDHDILVFLHDDVFIDDYFVGQRLIEGLKVYDVIGIAGNRRRLPRQHAWAFIEGNTLDRKYISGIVSHGPRGSTHIDPFGPVPATCELLDGVFLAARKSRLRQAGVRFDERFQFHFYDLDFCRSARQAGLRLGTWPIAVTHESPGRFGTPTWLAAREAYFEKWGD